MVTDVSGANIVLRSGRGQLLHCDYSSGDWPKAGDSGTMDLSWGANHGSFSGTRGTTKLWYSGPTRNDDAW